VDFGISQFSIVADYRLVDWSLIPKIYSEFFSFSFQSFLRPRQPPTLRIQDFYFDRLKRPERKTFVNTHFHPVSIQCINMHLHFPTRIFMALWSI